MNHRVFATGVLVLAMAFVSPVFAAENPDTLPNSSNEGPRVPAWDGSIMPGTTPAHDRCETLIEEGWGLVDLSDGAYLPRRLEGEVVAGHTPHGDFYFNHGSEDHNFFVYPDNLDADANDPTFNYWRLLGYGNFVTGEPKEHGRIEVETEYGAHTWNDAGDSGYYGFPSWVWPNIGDRVLVEGYWTFDCGHDEYRTEIHPAWFVVAYRNAMQGSVARGSDRLGAVGSLSNDDRDFGRVSRADVFIGSYGGEAVDNIFDDDVFLGPEDWWQPVNAKDYDFDIIAPPEPDGGGTLVWKVVDPPSSWQRPADVHEPSYSVTPFTRADGRAAVHVHVSMSALGDYLYLQFGKIFLVGWDVKEPDTAHLRVTFDRFNIFDDLEGIEQASWSSWAFSGDQSIFVRVSNGIPDKDDPIEWVCDSDENYMPYCEPDEDVNNYAEGSFDRFLGPEDQLVISIRAKEGDQPLDENDDAGFADQAFTEAENWGIGSHTLRQIDREWAGVYESDDSCDGPDGACYEVTYHIERIFDPTATTTGIPAVQYAQDPNHFTATVVTPGPPDKPRRRLPVVFDFTGGLGSQSFQGTSDDEGEAAPTTLITLPGGSYQLSASFDGNGLLTGSKDNDTVTIAKDFTGTALDAPDELRWGHNDAMTVTLMEPNVGQDEPALPVVGKDLVVTLSGPLGSQSYPVGPTNLVGTATLTPFMTLPPGNYQAVACFIEDAWFLGSCSPAQPVKVTIGFANFATGGPISVSGGGHHALGDMHSEQSVGLSGNTHVLSAAAGEQLQYGSTFTDGSVGSSHNEVQVAPFGIAPQYLTSTYCSGAGTVMGVPVTYVDGNWTIKNDSVLNGIYCVTGWIKIQSRVTGSATLVSTGTITKSSTAGGDQNLTTADPTGADVLFLSASMATNAITLAPNDAIWTGTVVAAGGVELGGQRNRFTGALVGRAIAIKGTTNTIDGR